MLPQTRNLQCVVQYDMKRIPPPLFLFLALLTWGHMFLSPPHPQTHHHTYTMSLSSMVVEEGDMTWKDLNLDPRIMQAVKSLRYRSPTLVQASAIPLALAGKDILARAGTGSGKTAAYSVPICHKLLQQPKKNLVGTQALILVPSKELCYQLLAHFRDILSHAEGALHVVDVSDVESHEWAAHNCNICIGTPTTVLHHVKAGNIKLDALQCCVVDEADALLSHPTIKKLRILYPTTVQAYLMSATLSPAVLELKKLLLNSPVVVKLEEYDDDDDHENNEEDVAQTAPSSSSLPNILQQHLTYEDDLQKYCFMYALIRFKEVSGKVLIFVDTTDKAYKLKLFLEKFMIRSVVLNSDIPLNSRNHIVSQFNVGEYNILIATDETRNVPTKSSKKAEYSVSRGIDFREVKYVVNFDSFRDFSETGCKSYIHRIGRTGRAGQKGVSITFVHKKEEKKQSWVEYLNLYLESKGQIIHPHALNDSAAEAMKLSYRTTDALLGIRKKAIREAKVKELVHEALTSQALKKHFSENPNDLAALKHVAPMKKKSQESGENNAFLPGYLATPMEGQMEVEEPVSKKRKRADSDDDGEEESDAEKTDKKKKGAGGKKRRFRKKADPVTSLKVSGDSQVKKTEAKSTPKKAAKPAAKKRKIVKKIVKKKSA